MNIEDHSSVDELRAKVAFILYGEHANTPRKTTPDRVAAASAGFQRDTATAPDNCLIMKDFLEYAMNTPPTISVDDTFIEFYYYLRTQPQGQNVGLLKLRDFSEEYSLVTRIRRRKYCKEGFYLAMATYNAARVAVFHATAEHEAQGTTDTERQVDNARCEMMKAAHMLKTIRACEEDSRRDLDIVINKGVFWGAGATP